MDLDERDGADDHGTLDDSDAVAEVGVLLCERESISVR